MPEITVEALRELTTCSLSGQGFDRLTAETLALEFVAAEISGIKTHGVGKLISMNLGDLTATPTIEVHGAVIVANGNGISGFVLLRQLAQQVGDLAAEFGIAAAFVRNFSRFSSLYPYPEILAERGLVGVLMNEAGPASVTPFGSLDPVTGANPICFSFPSNSGPRTIDLGTSQLVWGTIRQSALEEIPLPHGAFLDVAGNEPETYDDVNAVRAFGGAKGFAINLAIEILAGALVGGMMGNEVQSEFDAGALLMAFDPGILGLEKFKTGVDHLIQDVRAARPIDDKVSVHVPGDRPHGEAALAPAVGGMVTIPQKTLDLLERMASGENMAELAANPLFN